MSPEVSPDLNSIGVVIVSTGEVYLRSESGVRQIHSGDPVFQGEELVTGVDSSVEVRFIDDSLLSQGADSIISLDDFVYSDSDEFSSELFLKMGHGTFRMVTGKIAETNPERFKLGSPLATMGIRGTITVHEITPGGEEKHGVEEIHSGKALLVQSVDGSIRLVGTSQSMVDISATGMMGIVRPMSIQEFEAFREIAPESIKQEQEILEQREDLGSDEAGEYLGDSDSGDGEGEVFEAGSSEEAAQSVLENGVAGFEGLSGDIEVGGSMGFMGAEGMFVLGVEPDDGFSGPVVDDGFDEGIGDGDSFQQVVQDVVLSDDLQNEPLQGGGVNLERNLSVLRMIQLMKISLI